MFWVYKCNSRNLPNQVVYGDWNDFFVAGRTGQWGSTEWVKALAKAASGDTILAYQTDRKELVGLAKVVALRPRGQYLDLILKPLKQIVVRLPALKALDEQIAAIRAFQPSFPKTLYPIEYSDLQRLLRAAGLSIKLERRAAKAVTLSERKGAGFGSPLENKLTEDAAMKHVTKHFRRRGWEVIDVSKQNCHYDLSCTRKKSTVHVEVKGIKGSVRKFIITAPEKRQWEGDRSFVLAIVTNARSTKPNIDLHRGPESIRRFYFEALSFIASG